MEGEAEVLLHVAREEADQAKEDDEHLERPLVVVLPLEVHRGARERAGAGARARASAAILVGSSEFLRCGIFCRILG